MILVRNERRQTKFETVKVRNSRGYLLEKMEFDLFKKLLEQNGLEKLYTLTSQESLEDNSTTITMGMFILNLEEGKNLFKAVQELIKLNPDKESANGIVIKKIVEILN